MKRILSLLLIVVFAGCQPSAMDKYHSLVKKELNSNKSVNDIFFGISFGMISNDFYVHCWNMNKKGLFTDGLNNISVSYKIEKELKHPATMNFYPEFNKGRISKLWARFQYDGWMPWNKQLGSDSLLTDVLNLYQKWYPAGNPFFSVSDKERGTLYIKIDGNRQIILSRYDDVEVKADYTDLNVEQQLQIK